MKARSRLQTVQLNCLDLDQIIFIQQMYNSTWDMYQLPKQLYRYKTCLHTPMTHLQPGFYATCIAHTGYTTQRQTPHPTFQPINTLDETPNCFTWNIGFSFQTFYQKAAIGFHSFHYNITKALWRWRLRELILPIIF